MNFFRFFLDLFSSLFLFKEYKFDFIMCADVAANAAIHITCRHVTTSVMGSEVDNFPKF